MTKSRLQRSDSKRKQSPERVPFETTGEVVKWTSVAPVKSIVKLPCSKSRWAIRFPYLLLPYLRKEQYLWVTGASAALESRISKHDNWVWRKRAVFLPLLSPAIRRAQTNLFLIIVSTQQTHFSSLILPAWQNGWWAKFPISAGLFLYTRYSFLNRLI